MPLFPDTTTLSEKDCGETPYKAALLKTKPTPPGQHPDKNDTEERGKSKVVLIGNSQTHDINPDKFSSNIHLIKIVKYRIQDTRDWLSSSEASNLKAADAVVLHLLTNDIKKHTVKQCTDQMTELVEDVKATFNRAKIAISLGTPRDAGLQRDIEQVNYNLKQRYGNDLRV